MAFQGATGLVNFSKHAAVQTSYGIFQFQHDQAIQVGMYQTSLNKLSLNTSLLGDIPSDKLKVQGLVSV